MTTEGEIFTAEHDYDQLVADLVVIEDSLKDFARARGELYCYLVDSGIDHENSEHETLGSLAYWQAMYRSAASSAGARAEDYGLDINALLGRTIY